MKPLVAIFSYMKQGELDIEKEVLNGTDALVEFFSSEEEIEGRLGEISVLILANPEVDKKCINKMVNCKAIIRRGIGADNIDIHAATEKNIIVCNVPDYCYPEVSDLAMGLILALVRRIPAYSSDVKKGIWHIDSPKDALPLSRGLQNMTLGLAGFGNISREVSKKAKPFFRNIIAADPFVPIDIARDLGVELVSMEELFKTSDVVSLHVPNLKEMHHFVNKNLLSTMKKSAYLINTARGQLIDENDLYYALKNKRLAGAAIDVTDIEPPVKNNPLLELDNIIITPHIGFYSLDSFEELRKKAAEEAKRVIISEKVLHQLNKF